MSEFLDSLKECSLEDYYPAYINHLHRILHQVDLKKVDEVVQLLLQARESGNTIFLIGNGGSAATASHFSQDLASLGRKTGGKSFKTLSLTDNSSFITAIANDYGYENIFRAQMQEHFRARDILIAISASGNSANLLSAIRFAKEQGGTSIGFVGFDGGRMLLLCDYLIHTSTEKGEYGPVEDCHLILNHLITNFLMNRMLDNKNYQHTLPLAQTPHLFEAKQ